MSCGLPLARGPIRRRSMFDEHAYASLKSGPRVANDFQDGPTPTELRSNNSWSADEADTSAARRQVDGVNSSRFRPDPPGPSPYLDSDRGNISDGTKAKHRGHQSDERPLQRIGIGRLPMKIHKMHEEEVAYMENDQPP
jgi:hypothetical protein